MPDSQKAQRRRSVLDDVDDIKRETSGGFRRDRSKRTAKLVIAMRREGSLPMEGPIRVLVAVADAEGRPHDVSSLAVEMELPRTTVFRHLEQMRERGVVSMRREGRRTIVHLTDDGWREFAGKWEYFDPLVDDLVLNQIKYLKPDGAD